MLDRAHVSVNWWGQRLVSIDGYEGAVEINTLASKFLRSNPCSHGGDPSIQERLDYCSLWGRVQKLYTDSDEALKSTWFYRYFVPMIEFRPYCRACAGDPMAKIGEWDSSDKNGIFYFPPSKFKELWPGVKPLGESGIIGGGAESVRWIATEEMVRALGQR